MHQEALSRLQLETDLRLAFERAEFRVHYQPIVELQGGRLVGAEALVRWQHPRRGLLAPAEFLPLAEETGLIMDLDAWVLKQACAQLARWRAAHPELAGLSMNVNVDERCNAPHGRCIATSELTRLITALARVASVVSVVGHPTRFIT